MTDNPQNSGNPAGDMAEYLQTFLDETEEQLDDLVETMLALERDQTNTDDLNEAFRLIHSIKGSAGMMGFDSITVLTHHLENRFERLRSGSTRLDEPTMNLVLRCIDFLRQCNNRLRDGEQLSSSTELLDQLKRLEEQPDASHTERSTNEFSPGEPPPDELPPDDAQAVPSPLSDPAVEEGAGDAFTRMVVRFRPGLPLADLKAQLIVTRLSGLGEVKSTRPDLDGLTESEQLAEFEVRIDTREDADRLRAAADVDGVESIDFAGGGFETISGALAEGPSEQEVVVAGPADREGARLAEMESIDTESVIQPVAEPVPGTGVDEAQSPVEPVQADTTQEPIETPPQQVRETEPSGPEKATTKVAETMRVDIDRLDRLMNLAGELVVNRARLVQISGQIDPTLRKATMQNRVRDFSDGLRRTIESMENEADVGGDRAALIQQLRSGLELMEEQSGIWENGRHCLNQMGEAIDQLSRVSHSLQQGVLDTRMVPVSPLFNRFRRVVRDLSKERGKKVDLLIRGEKTELDKRMIDELGDPLVHLVRNSIDHGLEGPEVRVRRGKPEAGTITLEASHSGNNVTIRVRDDGGGIDVARVKEKLRENRVLSTAAVDELADEQALDYIWHPGFSTAAEVTDVSGRGVGMDVVKTRINQLNGTIEVDSTPGEGTCFTLRLPLTLAIIDSLLVRLRHVTFSMPIDDVREIVSVDARDVVTVQGKQTFDVRGEFMPLVRIEDIFRWHGIDYGYQQAKQIGRTADSKLTTAPPAQRASGDEGRVRDGDCSSAADAGPARTNGESAEVVVLQVAGKTVGLRVDELLGSQDLVIKSLSDNFVHIRGLSGASILGDGSVCLMLDVGMILDMATSSSSTAETKEVVT